ncbi:MAG: hypothetical protein IPJ66_00215 [Bacteroidetes bacterium]|nr:hypothetical protein [Bacteroidota bacterium]MBL0064807.1 hypothetical protein [Bacteroidota bacterium]
MRFFLLLLLLLSQNLSAQKLSPLVTARTDLMNLLQERKVLFDSYSASLRERSGIFGQRTKSDLRESQARLQEIVDTDNRIISALNRMLDYKNFEKLNLTYSANTNEERLLNLQQLSDTLSKQVDSLKLQNKKLVAESRRSDFYIFLIVLLSAALIAIKVTKNRGRGAKID